MKHVHLLWKIDGRPGRLREALFFRSRQREGHTITNRDNGNLQTRQWDPILGKLAKKTVNDDNNI